MYTSTNEKSCEPFEYSGRFVSFAGVLTGQCLNLLCGQHQVVEANVINQAGEETGGVKDFSYPRTETAICTCQPDNGLLSVPSRQG